MEEVLEKLYFGLSLDDDESTPIPTSDLPSDDFDSEICLIGKVLAPRKIHFDQIASMFRRLWNPKHGLTCKSLFENVVLFQFRDIRDKAKVKAGCPWLFDKFLLVLSDVPPDAVVSEFEFTRCPFWVQVHHVPINLMTMQFATRLGSRLGKFLEAGRDSEGSVIGQFLRIKVELDIRDPLRRILTTDHHGKSCKLFLRYERLPDFCYHCGILGHVEKDCVERILNPPDVSKQPSYRPWLRAPTTTNSTTSKSSPSTHNPLSHSTAPTTTFPTHATAVQSLPQPHNKPTIDHTTFPTSSHTLPHEHFDSSNHQPPLTTTQLSINIEPPSIQDSCHDPRPGHDRDTSGPKPTPQDAKRKTEL